MRGPNVILLLEMMSLLLIAVACSGGASQPAVPKAKGIHCVRDTEWMRRNHMELLVRERDETVHQGIRNKQETLPGCMSCHVSRLPDGHFPSVASKKFFCNSCHTYVGVKIDCFSCHTNRPDGATPLPRAATRVDQLRAASLQRSETAFKAKEP